MPQEDDLERKNRLLRAALLGAMVAGGALTSLQAQAHGLMCWPAPTLTAPADVNPQPAPTEGT